jgi:very-short-patch-repair endonuclease
MVHQHDAIRAGFTRYAVRRALERGELRRIRGPWLASADASPLLVQAARTGGRLACVSATRHHGLWTLEDARVHIAVPPHSSRHPADGAVLHWSDGPMASHPYELVEPVVNALMHVADCRPFDEAVATWESALRLRRVPAGVLARLPMRSAAARLVRTTSTALSDSGIESIPVVRLARIGIVARQQVVLDGHPVDILIGERLVLQIDGFEFHRGTVQRERDLAQDRRLRLLGYTVFRYGYRQVLGEWDSVESEVRLAMAQGLHLAR